MGRYRFLRTLAVFLLPALLPGCPERGKHQPGADGGSLDLLEMRITDQADHFLFTYLLTDGTFNTVEKVADVPEQARSQVVVIDTNLSPEVRESSQIIYLADLTRKREDGTFPCRPVSRFRFERDLLREPGKTSSVLPPECEKLASSPEDRVVLYSTSWCGVCKATIEFLKKENIPFLEKDVEKESGAQQELACKALKAGTRLNGVPVLDIAGTLLTGFDRDDILRLSKQLRKPTSPASPAPSRKP